MDRTTQIKVVGDGGSRWELADQKIARLHVHSNEVSEIEVLSKIVAFSRDVARVQSMLQASEDPLGLEGGTYAISV